MKKFVVKIVNLSASGAPRGSASVSVKEKGEPLDHLAAANSAIRTNFGKNYSISNMAPVADGVEFSANVVGRWGGSRTVKITVQQIS